MTQPTLSLTYKVQQPQQHAERPPLVILLHGYGSNEQDLIGTTPYLDPRPIYLSARAPHRLAGAGYAWFELGFTQTGISYQQEQAASSRDMVVAFVEEAIQAFSPDPARVFLAGFSQGAIMSAAATFSRPDLFAGTMLLSGRVDRRMLPDAAHHDALKGFPFLVQHGLYDDVLPITNGRESRDTLTKLGVDLTYHEYPMAHSVSLESLRDARAWLTPRLGV